MFYTRKEKKMETEIPETATAADPNAGKEPANTPADKGAEKQPYKIFSTQEEFDRHSAGILNSAQKRAEKELLALLGLKPDEKDKLAKFKEAYDSTLSESEKKEAELKSLAEELSVYKKKDAEKDAVIAAVTRATGRKTDDIMSYVKMAKGLVDENTDMEQAIEKVFSMLKPETAAHTEPTKGTPPANPSPETPEENPFSTGNVTRQGQLLKSDREKARRMYKEAKGKDAPW